MNPDRRLSLNFWLREFSGWETATALQLQRLEELVRTLLQPIRNRWGRIVPTSWVRWHDGRPRTGDHADGGTVDFVPLDAGLEEVWEWTRLNLPAAYGVLILEPPETSLNGETGHIHATRPGLRGRQGDAYVEVEEGVYADAGPGVGFPDGSGLYGDPIELPGLRVSVAGPGRWAWLMAGALLLALARTSRGARS